MCTSLDTIVVAQRISLLEEHRSKLSDELANTLGGSECERVKQAYEDLEVAFETAVLEEARALTALRQPPFQVP